MKYLERLLELVRKCKDDTEEKKMFFIPEAWNILGFYCEDCHNEKRTGEIRVSVYDFHIHYIEYILNLNKMPVVNKEIQNYTVYSALLRSLTAWNHSNQEIECGTFLKSIALLPYIKRMNINVLYLLPIFRTGNMYKKGNMGSVYAIKEIYKLDNNLHDFLLGEYTDDLLELQFRAFVEACHIMDIKVMVDFAFRTVSRDSDMIISHPEWFYWMDMQKSVNFKPLNYDNIEPLTSVREDIIPIMYENKHLPQYLENFTYSPALINKEKWNKLVKQFKGNKQGSILEEIQKEFNITTVPAFSDVINDFQNIWYDVTYLRVSYDTHEQAKKYIDINTPPYILQDVAKSSICCGCDINYELWQYIEEVIPYYQTKFQIDGARIDMGHALPDELNQAIIRNCRKINKSFILWSEELEIMKSKTAKDNAFDFISGCLWKQFRKYDGIDDLKKMVKMILTSELPVISTLETPDTSRIQTIYSDNKEKMFLIIISCFLPNTHTMINCGMEFGERQPMNFGFENIENTSDILDRNDEMNGLLALFDNYRMHWTDPNNSNIKFLLASLLELKEEYFGLFTDKKYFCDLSTKINGIELMIWSYMHDDYYLFLFSIIGGIVSNVINIKEILDEIHIDKDIKLYDQTQIFYITEKGERVYIENISEINISKHEVIFAVNRVR